MHVLTTHSATHPVLSRSISLSSLFSLFSLLSSLSSLFPLLLRLCAPHQALFFLGGWIYFQKGLFKDIEVHNRGVQFVFSTTFTLSCAMFTLIIFEIVGVLEQTSRLVFWQLTLSIMLFVLIVWIPLYLAVQMVGASSPDRSLVAKGVASVIGWGAYLYIFWIGLRPMVNNSDGAAPSGQCLATLPRHTTPFLSSICSKTLLDCAVPL